MILNGQKKGGGQHLGVCLQKKKAPHCEPDWRGNHEIITKKILGIWFVKFHSRRVSAHLLHHLRSKNTGLVPHRQKSGGTDYFFIQRGRKTRLKYKTR